MASFLHHHQCLGQGYSCKFCFSALVLSLHYYFSSRTDLGFTLPPKPMKKTFHHLGQVGSRVCRGKKRQSLTKHPHSQPFSFQTYPLLTTSPPVTSLAFHNTSFSQRSISLKTKLEDRTNVSMSKLCVEASSSMCKLQTVDGSEHLPCVEARQGLADMVVTNHSSEL